MVMATVGAFRVSVPAITASTTPMAMTADVSVRVEPAGTESEEASKTGSETVTLAPVATANGSAAVANTRW